MEPHLPSSGSQARKPNMRLRPLAPQGGISVVVISLSLVGHWTRAVGSDQTESLPLLTVSIKPSKNILSYRKSALLVFRSSLEIFVLCVVVVLVCTWEEVSSGSPYSAILATPSQKHTNLKVLCTLKMLWLVTKKAFWMKTRHDFKVLNYNRGIKR